MLDEKENEKNMQEMIPECFFRAATLAVYVMMAWGLLRLIIDIYRFKREVWWDKWHGPDVKNKNNRD